MERTLARISWLFLVLGLGLLCGGGYAASRVIAFLGRAVEAEGTVVDLRASTSSDHGTTYAPVVEYRLESGAVRTFTGSVYSAPPAYEPGERVAVLFDPADPADARLRGTSLYLAPILLGGLGALFAAIGGGMLGFRAARRRRAEELRLHGRRVQARLQSVELNTSLSVNGAHPWRIVCQWQDPTTGLVHLFKSENLWFDPTPYVRAREGETLTVFVDPRNPRRHHVDVSFLPRLAA